MSYLETTKDGKLEIVSGSEPLKKDPKKLKSRWKLLKKDLRNADSIMDIKAETSSGSQAEPTLDESSSQEDVPGQQEDVPGQQEDVPGQQEDVPGQQEGSSERQDPDKIIQEVEASEGGSVDQAQLEKDIESALSEAGYSMPEIAFILHSHHSPEVHESSAAKAKSINDMSSVALDNAKAKAEIEIQLKSKQADLEHSHEQRMKNLDYESAKSKALTYSIDAEHKKRLMDLEYDQAVSDAAVEKEHKKKLLELEIAARELDLKLKYANHSIKK
jgi:hypothetical protein